MTSNALNTDMPIGVVHGGTAVDTLTTAYGVLCAGTTATGAVQTLGALGSAGEVLTSNGPGALPSMQSSSGGGGIAYVSTTTLSNDATADFIGLNEAGASYYFILQNVVPATDNVDFYLRMSTDNGSSFDSGSNYRYNCMGRDTAGDGAGEYSS